MWFSGFLTGVLVTLATVLVGVLACLFLLCDKIANNFNQNEGEEDVNS